MNMVLLSSNITAAEFLTPVMLSLRGILALVIVLIAGVVIARSWPEMISAEN